MPRKRLNELEMLENTSGLAETIEEMTEPAAVQPEAAEGMKPAAAEEDSLPETGTAEGHEDLPAQESVPETSTEGIPEMEDADIEEEPAEEIEAPKRRLIFGIGLRELRELDANLSPAQRDEWYNFYSSYRSNSILTGTVAGVDETRIADPNAEGGERVVRSLVVIGYRVKILIPETEVWYKADERPGHVMRGLFGAQGSQLPRA